MSSNLEAARSGDRLLALEQARDTTAAAIDAAMERGDGTVAQLIAQYRGTLAEIAELKRAAAEAEPEVTRLEQIRARREARGDDAPNRSRASGHRKSRDG